MNTPHTHAWEIVERCFECDEIREYQPVGTPETCPRDAVRDAEMERLVNDLATEDWRGKPLGIKNAIFAARKLAGWKRTDWTS